MVNVKKYYGRPVICALILLLTLFTFFQTVLAGEQVELTTGTIFYVETVNKLDPKTLNNGDNVTLTVSADVMVNKKVVIKGGTPVEAVVATAKDRGMIGKAGEIGISVRTTKAVDGSLIMLSGDKYVSGDSSTVASAGLAIFLCPLFLLMEGEEAIISPHTKIEVRVAGSYLIEVE
mgnify:CR=1 FL=1